MLTRGGRKASGPVDGARQNGRSDLGRNLPSYQNQTETSVRRPQIPRLGDVGIYTPDQRIKVRFRRDEGTTIDKGKAGTVTFPPIGAGSRRRAGP